MKKYSGFILIISIIFWYCKPVTHAPVVQLVNKTFKGTFVNQTYLNQIQNMVAGAIPFYCSSLSFKSVDSVEVKNGIESLTLAIRIHGDTCTLMSAYATAGGFENINCFYVNDSVLTLLDTGFTTQSAPSQFIRANTEVAEFPSAINQATIAGKYQYTKDKSSASIVVFTNDGKVTGLSPFTNYEICYSGDCLSEPLVPANIILLTSKKKSEAFTWHLDKNTSQLHLNYLAKPSTDIKGERKIIGEFKSLKKL